VVAEILHDVPKNRSAADLDHWLGAKLSFFAQTRTLTAAKNHGLHEFSFQTDFHSTEMPNLCIRTFSWGKSIDNEAKFDC
jgi:hypothetical protein